MHALGEPMHVVRVTLADDRGEAYQWDGSGFGEAWDFEAEAHFSPAVHPDASALQVTFLLNEVERATVDVPLGPHS